MRNIYIINSIILVFIFGSCNIVETGENTAIDSKIGIKFIEWHTETIGNPKIYLHLQTDKIYPYASYGLNIKENIIGKYIHINILGIKIATNGPTTFGPAIESLPLDLPNGEYNLIIVINRRSDRYLVNISDSEISINSSNGVESYVVNDKYFRYPKYSLAYCCQSSIPDKYIFEDFLDSLKSKISIKEFSFPDDGEIPYPEAGSGETYIYQVKYFLYESEEDYNKINSIIRNYNKTVIKDKQGIFISIFNWRNDNIYAWYINK